MDTLLFEKISVDIPDGFECVEGEACKHFFGLMPLHYAFLSQQEDGAIGVVYSETQLENEQVKDRIIEYQQYYSRMVPGFQMGEMRINDQIGRNVAFFSYKSNAPTMDLYNMLAITTWDGRELIFIFSCGIDKAMGYMNKFLRVLTSMSFPCASAEPVEGA